jgi:hypothetical protein
MDEQEKEIWVNTKMEPELVALLDKMVRDDGSDRSKFIRRLIRQEHARRQIVSVDMVQGMPGTTPVMVATVRRPVKAEGTIDA